MSHRTMNPHLDGIFFLKTLCAVVGICLSLSVAATAQAATHTLRGVWGSEPAFLIVTDPARQDTFRSLTNAYMVVTSQDRAALASDAAVRALNHMGGLSQTGYSAALYLDQTGYLHRNAATQIVVDGTGLGIPYNNYLFLAENSLVAFDAQSLDGDVLFQGDTRTRALFDPGAGLLVVNAVAGRDITLLDDFVYVQDFHYLADNLEFSNRMFQDSALDINLYTVSIHRNGAAGTFAGISDGAASLVDGLFTDGRNDINSDSAAMRYISRATDQLYGDTGRQETAAALESIGQLGTIAGVQATSFMVSQNFADLMLQAPQPKSRDFTVWGMPFYQYANVNRLRTGRLDNKFESRYGGGVIGGEASVRDDLRLGLAFAVGTGETETRGTFRKTKSEFDFWGIGGYIAFTRDRFTLTGDLGYTDASYEVTQRINPAMGMGDLEGDVDTTALSVALTGEYRFTVMDGKLDVTPYAGVRYTNLYTDSYSIKSSGHGDISKVDSATQDIWTFPLGVAFSGDAAGEGLWTVKPLADVGVIFAAGDTDVRTKARIHGTDYGGSFTADVVDDVTMSGRLGLEAAYTAGLRLRLDYTLKASENLTSHGLGVTFGYEW